MTVWEGRSVWCSGDIDGSNKGWVELKEIDVARVRIVIRKTEGGSIWIDMTREEALTFFAQGMNLARRTRT